MQVYGVDLPVWLSQRRYRAVLELIDGLPSASRLREAIFNDPVEAERILANRRRDRDREFKASLFIQGDVPAVDDEPDDVVPDPVWRPRMSEWDVTAVQLASLDARLQQVTNTIASANAGKQQGSVSPFPAPRTLVDVLDDSEYVAGYRDALAVFSPHLVSRRGS